MHKHTHTCATAHHSCEVAIALGFPRRHRVCLFPFIIVFYFVSCVLAKEIDVGDNVVVLRLEALSAKAT